MNSELRVHRLDDTWQHYGYVNLPVLCGIERKGVDAGKDLRRRMAWWDLGSRSRELVRAFTEKETNRLMSAFIQYHRDILVHIPDGITWNCSELLGGAGLPGGDEIPQDCLRNAAALAVLSNEERLKILHPPKFDGDSWIQQVTDEAEKFYSAMFGTVEVPTGGLLPRWLRPDERAPAISRPPVIGFVARKFLLIAHDENTPFELEEPKSTAQLEALFHKRVLKYRRKLQFYLHQIQNQVLQPMREAKARSWVPDTESIVNWGRIPYTIPARLTVPVERLEQSDDVDVITIGTIPEWVRPVPFRSVVDWEVLPRNMTDYYWNPSERERLRPLLGDV